MWMDGWSTPWSLGPGDGAEILYVGVTDGQCHGDIVSMGTLL